jgi:hypothetical protein
MAVNLSHASGSTSSDPNRTSGSGSRAFTAGIKDFFVWENGFVTRYTTTMEFFPKMKNVTENFAFSLSSLTREKV